LNDIGTIPSDQTGCDTLKVNVTAGEFYSRVALIYTDTQVTMVVAASEGKTTLVKGTQPAGSTVQSWSFNSTSNPMVGFHGLYTDN